MAKYIIALGSSHNFGPKYFAHALDEMLSKTRIIIKSRSQIYKNSAKGTPFNRLFFNCAIGVESAYQPLLLYRELKVIEQKLGRLRGYPLAPRTLDIDVLMSLGISYQSSNFFLPHKELHNRSFFILPAIEAINLAGWALPLSLIHARSKHGAEYLCRMGTTV